LPNADILFGCGLSALGAGTSESHLTRRGESVELQVPGKGRGMCYNISIAKNRELLEAFFRAYFADPDAFKPAWLVSAFNRPEHPVVLNAAPAVIDRARWGLVPSWTKDAAAAETISSRTFNARAETILEKPAFRVPARQRRCLVLADGFFEWRAVKGRKYPYYIHRADGAPFALAGLWDTWRAPGAAGNLRTFTVVTTEANPLMAAIHNIKKRMPVILPHTARSAWLDPDLPPEDVRRLCAPYATADLEAYPVPRLVSDVRADRNRPEAVERTQYPDLPPLEQ
jgi:putative SOS response-associated peptidase YedK